MSSGASGMPATGSLMAASRSAATPASTAASTSTSASISASTSASASAPASASAAERPERMYTNTLTYAGRTSTAMIAASAMPLPTVFPTPIANLVTALATSARLSLRVTAFFIEVILETSQYSTRVSLGYTRRLLISAISSARRVYLASNAALDGDLLAAVGLGDPSKNSTDAFLNVLDRWTNLGIYVIHHTFTLAELFAMSGFYLTANTVSSASFAAHESVTLFDSLFGSNESSRALSSIITLVRKELLEDDRFNDHGKVATLTALTKAMTAFACLQNATWQRTSKRLRMKVLYDCTVITSDDETFTPGPSGAAQLEPPTTLRLEAAPVDADGDVAMGTATPPRRPRASVATLPPDGDGADLEALLQHLVGDEPYAEPYSPTEEKPPVLAPQTPRRLLKRVRGDMYEITDELSESTVVTQTLERVGGEQRLRTRASVASMASIPDVRVEDVDMETETVPTTPIMAPTAVEDDADWIEVDQLLDEPKEVIPSAGNGSSSGTSSDMSASSGSTERIQLVLRTMTNKLLQRKRTVRRVRAASSSPSPPPTEKERDRRSRSPLAGSAAAPVVAAVAATRDVPDARRADVRGIPWEQERPADRPTSPRKPPPSALQMSPSKEKRRLIPRRSLMALKEFRKTPREPFPGVEDEDSASGASTPRASTSTARAGPSRLAAPVTPPDSPPASSLRCPPPTPYTARHRLESVRTRNSRVHAASSQLFDIGPPRVDDAASLFPHDSLIKNIHRFMRYSSAAYGQSFLRILGLGNADFNFPTTGRHHANSWAFAQHTNIPIDSLLLSSYTENYSPTFASGKAPPLVHYIAVDHDLKAVVLTCRGTLGLSDVLVDLTCDYRKITLEGGKAEDDYFVHSGMWESALQLTAKRSHVHNVLKDALEEYPAYGLVLCGHSLGGGVAALLAIESSVPSDAFLIENATRERAVEHPGISTPFVTSFASGLPPGRPIHAYAYGCPAVASPDLARRSAGLITSVVQNADVVPTLSLGVLRDLKNIAVTLFEEKGVAEEIVARILGLKRGGFEGGGEEEEMLDDWMMSLIKTMRADMGSDKLFPPGMVYIMEYFDVFVTVDAVDTGGVASSSKQAQRVILRRCDSVEERFREPLFSKTMLNDHLPSHYERSTHLLCEGLGQGLI